MDLALATGLPSPQTHRHSGPSAKGRTDTDVSPVWSTWKPLLFPDPESHLKHWVSLELRWKTTRFAFSFLLHPLLKGQPWQGAEGCQGQRAGREVRHPGRG